MKKRLIRGSALLATLLVLAGCAVGPDTSGPRPPPAAYKEAALPASEAGSWKTAEPAEQALRGEWWKLFGDEGLNQLQEEALRANQNLQAAAARLTQARALQREARAAFFPSLDAAFGPSRQRPSAVSRGLTARRPAVDHLARPGQRGLRGRPVRPRFVNGRRRHRRRAAERSAVPLGAAGAAGRRRHHLLPGARAGRRGAALPPDSAAAHRGAATDPAPL